LTFELTTYYTIRKPSNVNLASTEGDNVFTRRFLSLIPVLVTLSGCGGGGGGGGSGGGSLQSFTIQSPNPVSSSQFSTTGTANIAAVPNYGKATISLDTGPYSSENVQAKTESNVQFHPTDHLTDTGATTAWASGWTGNGQKIGVIDDFSDPITLRRDFTISRTATDTGYDSATFPRNPVTMTGTYDVTYKVLMNVTHGALVSNIAGGDSAGSSVAATANFDATSRTLTNCDTNGAVWFDTCSVSSSFYFDDSSAGVTYNKVAGVARDATVTETHVDLSSGNTTSTTSVISHVNTFSSGFASINLSISMPLAIQTWSEFETGSNTDNHQSLLNSSEAVIVVAAGNEGASCQDGNLEDCNYMALVVSSADAVKDQSLIVGALNGDNDDIASYSNKAGVVKERYILASGETGYLLSNGSAVVGTSFAAPRVSGAVAILRHKFPNLNASQTSDVLLLTADKDIDGNGSDDFSGTSEIYGHGKLDLLNALSPIGTLAVQ
jgi:hypothetical protein